MAVAPALQAGLDGGATGPDPLDAYVALAFPAADGLDFPLGDRDGRGAWVAPASGRRHRGFKVTRAPGGAEDWDGRGPRDADRGLEVRILGAGRVVSVTPVTEPGGATVVVEHVLYENHEKRTVLSSYHHLSRVDVAPGQEVARRQAVGGVGADLADPRGAHLTLEVRAGDRLVQPSPFIRARRSLPVPPQEPVLVLVHHATGRVRVVQDGRVVMEHGVGFGQEPGRKERLHDLKTPMGMYFVVTKSQGPFGGDYADYYGGHWVKLNYPNAYDGERGVAEGLITPGQQRAMAKAWRARALTSQGTALGGGIGFHGWAAPWDAGPGGAFLSWGCVVLQPSQIRDLYDRVEEGTMVVIF
jgi:hypothetical protein